ncbi:MAG: gfo/Idh/MocA family oxidoreductase, partial [Segetibacter sp.]|nr:gfo/Idh/MocA family oxidoreductase [Segetibacter sp.]
KITSMKSNRRNFLKLSGMTGVGLAGAQITSAFGAETTILPEGFDRKPGKHFNMSGFAAPKLETVRIGFIGLGNRGPAAVIRMSKIDGVDIKGLCDLRSNKADAAKKLLEKTPHHPTVYTGNENEWKRMCDSKDIDLIYIATPWSLHAPMAVYAMNQGKHVCIEVPAAKTIDECWQLVETSERTRKHCMILENCCYDFFELLTLNMARQGFFGEIVHTEGAYLHDLLTDNFDKKKYWNMWRLKENFRNGCLYPTHGLGPVAQILDINRGDKMDYLVSVSSNDFSMAPLAKELAAKDDFYKPYENKSFRGNTNTTTIKTAKGKTIKIQHDVSSMRPYSRIHLVSGTKGAAEKYPLPGRIANTHEDWLAEDKIKALQEKYEPPIVKRVGEMAKQVGGHGGMDFLMDWRTIDCLRNGLPLDINVYDAALWSSIAPLSEWSVANRSNSISVPDFTQGSWKTNEPVDILLQKGGNTKVFV